jgi:hypothetical protein
LCHRPTEQRLTSGPGWIVSQMRPRRRCLIETGELIHE